MRNINLFLCPWAYEFIKNSLPTQNIKTTSDQSPCPCNLSEKKKRYATLWYKNIGSFFQIWIWWYKPEISIHSTMRKKWQEMTQWPALGGRMPYLEISMYLVTLEFLLLSFSKKADVNGKKYVVVFLGSEVTFNKLHLLVPSLN